MSTIPANLKYTTSHEWVKTQDDGTLVVGITCHAQELLGDVVFVELPEVGSQVTQGEEFSLIESVKAASDIYAPVSGEVIAVNTALEEAPETVNESPFEQGWIARIQPAHAEELDSLLDAAAYATSVEQEG